MRSLASLLCVGAVLGASLIWVPAAVADHCNPRDRNCVHTGGDQEGGSVVTEATEFPNAGPGSDLAKATEQHAGCINCEWSLVPACSTNSPTTQGDVLCNGAVATCQVAGQLRYRVYMRRPPGPWLMQGTVCLGRNQRPPTVADVGDAVRERVVNYLPDADPSFQPAQGGIVNLPTLFAAGEPRTMRTAPFDVLGFRVVVTATARWEWTFEDGVTMEFARPGGAYPNDDVAYTYPGPGARRVSVTTYWDAQFTVDGQGPFDVPGPEISKTAGPFDVPVREANSELIAGS